MTIRVEASLYEAIASIAQNKKISINSAAIEAFQRYVKKNNSLLAVARNEPHEENIHDDA